MESKKQTKEPDVDSTGDAALSAALRDTAKSYKLVLVVRRDLKMGIGKIAAQCGHASLGIYRLLQSEHGSSLQPWLDSGQAKVVCRVDSLLELEALADKAKQMKVPTYTVRDAGRTQVEAGSSTVLAIGPAESSLLDTVTGKLKLL